MSDLDVAALRLTAYHEAGHAVAHALFRLAFTEVHIVPCPGLAGALIGDDPISSVASFNNIRAGSLRSRRWIKRKIVALLAGPTAHERKRGWRGLPGEELFDTGCDHDVVQAHYWAWQLYHTDGRKGLAYVKGLLPRAVRLWEAPEHWRAVEAVAESLLRQPYHWLPADIVRRIVRMAN